MLLFPGDRVSHYSIVGLIGHGGMGAVYRAHDGRLGREVALKLLAAAEGDEDALRRFELEARAVSAIQHPNVLTVFDVGRHQQKPYLVTELLQGETLRDRMLAGSIPLSEALDLATQLLLGLQAAHARGIVHRDLKPENIFLTAAGQLKILDFGIAKMLEAEPESGQATKKDPGSARSTPPLLRTQSGMVIGTIGYMSPEQMRGTAVDARSDLFSFGAVLHEALSGKHPFVGEAAVELGYSILHDAPLPLPENIPKAMREVVRRALEKKKEDRFASAAEVLPLLASMRTQPLHEMRARGSWKLAAGAASVVALILLIALALWKLAPPSSSGPPAIVGTATKGARPAVAVLGFRNLSARPDAAWLSTALAEMMSSELSAGEKLRTIPGETVSRARIELQLPDSDSFAPETLLRIGRNLGVLYVVSGSYATLGGASKKIRLDLHLQEVSRAESLGDDSETGDEDSLFELVARAGAFLRERLGAGNLASADQGGVRSALPANAAAARLYAEGLDRLRVFDALGAHDVLERAVDADPTFALAHAELSEAWKLLGYDLKAREQAKIAFESGGQLLREPRMFIEARYRALAGETDRAIAIYQDLVQLFPDHLEYLLDLIDIDIHSGHLNEALEALKRTRAKAGAAERSDPRLDLAEAAIYNMMSNYPATLSVVDDAIAKARKSGQTLVLAKALLIAASANQELSQAAASIAAASEAKQIYSAAGDRRGVADALDHLAWTQHTWTAVIALQEQVEEIDRQIGNRSDLVVILGVRASVESKIGNTDRLPAVIAEGTALEREVPGDNHFVEMDGSPPVVLSLLRVIHGDLAGGQAAFEQRLAYHQKSGDSGWENRDLMMLGDLAMMKDELSLAETRYRAAMALGEKMGHRQWNIEIRQRLSLLLLCQGKAEEAAKSARESLLAPGDIALSSVQPGATWASALLEQRKVSEGGPALESRLAEEEESDIRDVRVAAAGAAALLHASLGAKEKLQEDEARLLHEQSEAERLGYVNDALQGSLALARLQLQTGRVAKGKAALAAVARKAKEQGFLWLARQAASLAHAGN